MDVRPALKSQYRAVLATLREAIEKCPDAMWNESADGSPPFWRVAYHTLFYAHFYLQQNQEAFKPWVRHRDEAQFMRSVPGDEKRPPRAYEPYTRQELLEYSDQCVGMVDSCVDALDLAAPQSGFPWYQMPKFEHQIVNIRHIQHHAAILANRLRRSTGLDIDWVAKG
jgi:hypothetical protein